jgi:hypothetical protein
VLPPSNRSPYSPPVTSTPCKLWRSWIAALVCLPMTLGGMACKSGNAAQKLAESTAPTLEGSTGKCKPGNEASKSLVVEWPMGDRAALEGRVNSSLVAVRYRNCEMELITNCSVQGSYKYISVTPKSENVRITNADELYAKIPIGAVKLEGKLERDGELNVDMVLVGRHESDRYRFQVSDLDGRCEGATHVVTGLTVGAFVFYSGAGADIGLGGEVRGTGVQAGAGSTASRELLSRDGDPEKCIQSPDTIAAPPIGCGALLQVEVVPIDRPPATYTDSSGVTQLADPNEVAGENLDTDTLDRRIKVAAFGALSGYVIAASGIFLVAFGANLYLPYRASDSSNPDVGQAGTAERDKYISRYNTSLGMLFGGVGATVLGLGLGLFASVRLKKLRNERSTRLAGIEFAPVPGGGMFVGSTWRF